MRSRNRPAYTREELSRVYVEPFKMSDHPASVKRTALTIALAQLFDPPSSVADLSCGHEALIARSLGAQKMYLGDIAGHALHGPIEETIHRIPKVDLFVLSDTVERLDNPELVLKWIRQKTKRLVISSPLFTPEETDGNPEHYWSFDREDLHDLLVESKFAPRHLAEFDDRPYGYRWHIAACT